MRRVVSCPFGCPIACSRACEISSARTGSWPVVPTTLLTPDGVGHCGGAAPGAGCSRRGKQRIIDRGGPSAADIAWPVVSSRLPAATYPCQETPLAVPANEAVAREADGHVEACPLGRGGGAA